MIKIKILADDPVYRGHAKFEKGMTGYITKYTQEITERYGADLDEPSTNIRFAASMMGYEGREPIYCWVPNRLFRIVK